MTQTYTFNKRGNFYIIAIVFLVNLSFKLFNLTYEPIWYDECFSIFYSQGSFAEILNVSKWDIAPPFFNLLLHCWIKLFGTSELSMRMVPTLLSSATGAVLYVFLKKYIDFRTAITASVLYLFSNISFYYAHEVRGYTFILLISILSIWFFVKLLEKPTYLTSIGLAITYYMLLMTHYLSFFILLSQGILFIIFFNKRLLKFYLISIASFILILAHWLPRLIEILKGGSKHWVQSPNLNNLIDFIYVINNGFTQLVIFSILACIGLISIIINKEQLYQSKAAKAIIIYSILISFITVIFNYVISSTIPIFVDRYLLFTLIGFIILFAFFISKIRLSTFYFYFLLCTLCIHPFTQTLINVQNTKMDYRGAVNYVKLQEDSSSIIFIQTVDVSALFAYYYDKNIFHNYSNLENSLKEKHVFIGNDSIKIQIPDDSVFTKIIHVETYSELTDPQKTVEAWFNVHGYKKINEEKSYNQVKISIYKKKLKAS